MARSKRSSPCAIRGRSTRDANIVRHQLYLGYGGLTAQNRCDYAQVCTFVSCVFFDALVCRVGKLGLNRRGLRFNEKNAAYAFGDVTCRSLVCGRVEQPMEEFQGDLQNLLVCKMVLSLCQLLPWLSRASIYASVRQMIWYPHDLTMKNLVFTDQKINDLMTTSMPEEASKAWFGAAPPDLRWSWCASRLGIQLSKDILCRRGRLRCEQQGV